MSEQNNQSLTVKENENLSTSEFGFDIGFVPQNQEQFDMIKELLQSAAALDGLELPKVTSKELAASGEIFDVVDATISTIEVKVNGAKIPKQVVTFMIESPSRELTAVMKDGNSINLQYATFFSNFKAIGKPQRRNGMMFVERTDLPKISGNHPIVLQKAKPEMKQVGGKK